MNKPAPRGMSPSTKRAMERVNQGQTAYSAAKDEGIALSTIYRALARARRARKKKARHA